MADFSTTFGSDTDASGTSSVTADDAGSSDGGSDNCTFDEDGGDNGAFQPAPEPGAGALIADGARDASPSDDASF